MKNTITCCLLGVLAIFVSHAQVGIGTTSPQEALHIAGSGSTLRVEGLNSSNNNNNFGGGSSYYVALDFESYDGTAKIDDGRAKVAHNYFYLGNGTTADTSKSYGMTSSVYTNINCDTATGFIYNSRSMTIALDPGTYSVHLQGAVFGGNLTADAAFRVKFGNGDRLDIQAIYL